MPIQGTAYVMPFIFGSNQPPTAIGSPGDQPNNNTFSYQIGDNFASISNALAQGPINVGALNPPVLPNGNDQTSNLQAGIDHYSASGGAMLQFSAGTYIFNSAIILKPGIILRGVGIDITILKVGVDNITLIDRWGSVGSNTGTAGIEQMTVWGYGDRNPTLGSNKLVNIGPFNLYWIRQVKGINSRNMTFSGLGTIGIVDSCVVNQSFLDGINLTGSNYVEISNNDVSQCGDDGITCHLANGTTGTNDYSARITNNRVQKAYGIKCLGARNATISNNTLRFYYGYGVQVGLDTGSGEGYITKFDITISNNALLDGLNGTVIGAGDVGYAIWFNGSQSLGSGGPAIPVFVGQYLSGPKTIQTPDVFINQAGPTQPRACDGTITVSGNAVRQTLKGSTHFADYGFGNLWSNAGSVNPAFTGNIGTMAGVALQSDIENFVVTGNAFHGVGQGVQTGNGNVFSDGVISKNTFERIGFNGITLLSSGSLNQSHVMIERNNFDIDPYFERSNRTTPIDGTWTNTTDFDGNAIHMDGYAFVSVIGNRFRNCLRGIRQISGNLAVDKNWYIFSWTSGLAIVRGLATIAGSDPARDFMLYCDSDPRSGTYGQFDSNVVFSNGSMPAAGNYVQGTIITNFTPTKDVNNLTLIGWVRLTSGSGNVSGTDWANMYVKHTSP